MSGIKDFVRTYNYGDTPTIARFSLSNKRIRLVMGPFGCLRGDQLIVTSEGLVPISLVTPQTLVLSWNENSKQFVFLSGSGAFPKGTDYLYRVSTPQGEFVAASHHRVFVGANKYLPVSDLRRGDALKKCSFSHLQKYSYGYRKLFRGDDRYFWKKSVNSLERCGELIRQYGQQLLQAANIYPAFVPLRDGVPELFGGVYSEFSVRTDGWVERPQLHTRPNQFSVQTQICDSSGRVVHPNEDVQDCILLPLFSHISESVRQFLRSQRKKVFRHIKKLFPWCFRSYSSSLSEGSIISIERLKVKEKFWDMQIPNTNNYVTEDGTIHHNSGKSSGMIAEIIRRAHEQVPSTSDGIRRIRVAVVRNCFDSETEILTETRGWQLFKNLTSTDKVASLVDGKELVFVEPELHYADWYKGEMLGFSSRSVDFLVTPDHKQYVAKRNTAQKIIEPYKLQITSDIYGFTHYRFKNNADEYNGGETEFSEKMFEFFGFWFAEGYVGKYKRKDTIGYHWRFVVTQKENINYVKNLLDDCGFKYGQNKKESGYNYSIYINDDIKKLIEKLLPTGNAKTKFLPNWIKGAPRGHLKAFLKGYEEGDGHTRLHKNDSTRLYTSSERLANDLQEIIIKAGGSASLNKRITKVRDGSFKGQGFVFVLTVYQENQFHPQTNAGWYKQNYDGMVYCLEVPSHVVLVRRNNRVMWSSQTYSQLSDSTIKSVHYWLPPERYGLFNKTEHNYFITAFPGVHIELNFRALDRPDQVDNLLSVEYTFAWFNEYREIPWAVFEAMDGRVDRFPAKAEGGCTWAGIIGDTNPPDEYSPYYKFIEGPWPNAVTKEKPKNAQLWKQPSGLSPNAENLKNLARNYYKNLAANKSDSFVNVYVHGKYGYTEEGKPVYAKSYNDNTHISTNILEPIKNLPLVSGWDFGLNPSVVIAQILPTGRINVLRALSSDGIGLENFCLNTVLPMLRIDFFGMRLYGYGDPAGTQRGQSNEQSCYDIYRLPTINLHDIEPASTNSLVPRIGAAEKLLNKMVGGEPALMIDSGCDILRKALASGYKYKKIKGSIDQQFSDVPDKGYFSHIANAFEYLCLYINDSSARMDREATFRKQISKTEPHRQGSMIAGY